MMNWFGEWWTLFFLCEFRFNPEKGSQSQAPTLSAKGILGCTKQYIDNGLFILFYYVYHLFVLKEKDSLLLAFF